MAPESQFLLFKLQCQSLLLSLSAKEYDAPWLVNTKTTFRDAFGRFASKGAAIDAAIASQIEDIRESWQQIKLTADASVEASAKLAEQMESIIGSKAAKFRKAMVEGCARSSAEFKELLGQDPFPEYTQRIKEVISVVKSETDKVTAPIVGLINTLNEQNKKVLRLLYDPDTLKDQPRALQLAAKAIAGIVSVGVLSVKTVGIQCLSALLFPLLATTPLFVASPITLVCLKASFDNILLLEYIDDLAKKYFSISQQSKDLPLTEKAAIFAKEIAGDTIGFIVFSCLSDFGVKLIKGTLLEIPAIAGAYQAAKSAAENAAFQSSVKQTYKWALSIADQVEGSAVDLPEQIWKVKNLPAHIANKAKQGKLRGVYPVERKMVTHVLSNVGDKEAAIVSKLGGTKEAEALVSLANANLRRVYDNTSMYVRAPVDKIDLILRDSQFKSTLAINTRSAASYIEKRSKVEEKLFGYDLDGTDPLARPIYGFLARSGNYGKNEGVNTQSYGSVAIKLKDSVRNQVTALGQDSFWTFDTDYVPSFLNSPSIATYIQDSESKAVILGKLASLAKASDPLELLAVAGNGINKYGDKVKANYMEFCVHNRLTRNEVEEVVFTNYSQKTIDKIIKAISTDGKLAERQTIEDIKDRFIDEIKREKSKIFEEGSLEMLTEKYYLANAFEGIVESVRRGIKVSGSPGGYL